MNERQPQIDTHAAPEVGAVVVDLAFAAHKRAELAAVATARGRRCVRVISPLLNNVEMPIAESAFDTAA